MSKERKKIPLTPKSSFAQSGFINIYSQKQNLMEIV